MAATVFPTVNDVGPSDGAGRVATESTLSALFEAIARPAYADLASYRGFVVSGLELSPDTGYDFELSAGVAIINGYCVTFDAAETITGAASKQYQFWLELSRDIDDNVDGVTITTQDILAGDPTPTGDDVLFLGTGQTDSGGALWANNEARARPIPVVGSYAGAGGTVTIELGFTPSLVIVYGDGLTSFSDLIPPGGRGFGEDDYGASYAPQPGFYIADGGADATPAADYTLRTTKTYSTTTNVPAGSVHSDTVTVSGAAVGDPVIVGQSGVDTDGPCWGRVSSTNTVTFFYRNPLGSDVDLNGETFRIAVLKQQSGGITVPAKDVHYDGSGTGQKIPQIREGGFAVNGSVTPSLNRSGVFYKFIAFP